MWGPSLLFDPFDLYATLKPRLPTFLQWNITMPSDWAFVALIGLVIWAAVLTFHETRIKVLPKPRTRPDARIREALNYLVHESEWGCRQYKSYKDIRMISDDACAMLRQAAAHGDVIFWGLEKINKDEKDYRYDTIEKKIPEDFWQKNRFDFSYDKGLPLPETVPERDEEKKSGQHARYRKLRVDMSQIRECWPRASRRKIRKMNKANQKRLKLSFEIRREIQRQKSINR